MDFAWNEERVEELKKLVEDGLSFSQIAKVMGARSRNVVLCKFNRLKDKDPNLAHPNSNALTRQRVERAPRVYVPRVPVVLALPSEPVVLDGEIITLENLTSRMCKYPIGDPCGSDFRFCGHSQKEGSVYCEPHHRKCRQPNTAYVRKVDHSGKARA